MKGDKGQKEWLNDYMSLKQVNQNNPFTVPEGYFHDLEKQITSRVRLEELKGTDDLQGFTVPRDYFTELSKNIQSRINIEEAFAGSEKNFSVPEGYFDELTQNIQSRINIESSSDASEKDFAVPGGYFEELSERIQSRIAIEEKASSEEIGFAVPKGYFEELGQRIESAVRLEEMMNEGKTSQGFTTPDQYFEKLNRTILNKTANKDIVKRKTIIRRMYTSVGFKYATAACFAMVIGSVIFIKQTSDPVAVHNSSYLHKALSNVPVGDIQNYLELHLDATDAHGLIDNGQQVNPKNLDADLQDYLDSN